MVETWHSPDTPDRTRVNREITSAQYHPQAYVRTHTYLSNWATHTLTLAYTYINMFFFFVFPHSLQDKLMSECAGSIDSIKRVKLILNEEEQLEDQGLTVFSAADKTGTAVCIMYTHSYRYVHSNIFDLCPLICGFRCDRAMGAPAGAVVQRATGSSAVAQTEL